MSSQTFEILCPVCRSVVPPEAPGCPNCAGARLRESAATADGDGAAPNPGPAQVSTAPAASTMPDLRGLPMKDYHRVVRATYAATERTGGGARVHAYLPFAILVLLLVLGAAVIFGHVP